MIDGFDCNKKGRLVWMSAPAITAAHAFTSRYGGISDCEFESLNLGENRGDLPERVRENYRIICAALGFAPDRLAFTRQVHGCNIQIVQNTDSHKLFDEIPYEADGIVSTEKGLTLVAFTADCAPLLMHDPVKSAAAAVHCGWRGTVSDIAGRAVEAMISVGCKPSDIRAAIGPCIGACCFEVGPEVVAALKNFLGQASDGLFRPAGVPDKFFADIKEANRRRLQSLGLRSENIAVSGECTYCSCDKYWSHRKTGGIRGSQAAMIML